MNIRKAKPKTAIESFIWMLFDNKIEYSDIKTLEEVEGKLWDDVIDATISIIGNATEDFLYEL